MFGFFTKIKNTITEIVYKQGITDDQIKKIELILLPIFGHVKTQDIIYDIKYSKDYNEAIDKISQIIINILIPMESNIDFFTHKPNVILLCGVNGSGKTTVAGKLSHYFKQEYSKHTVLAACDVFRAAAVEQLTILSQRTDSLLVCQEKGTSSSVAYKAIDLAIEKQMDCVILDTSGRLQNNKSLMNELKKTYTVAAKKANCMNILVLDALLGYNTIDQINQFNEYIKLDGLIINKIDNISLISGVVLQIAEKFPHLSIFFIGVGERISDLKRFKAKEFVAMCL